MSLNKTIHYGEGFIHYDEKLLLRFLQSRNKEGAFIINSACEAEDIACGDNFVKRQLRLLLIRNRLCMVNHCRIINDTEYCSTISADQYLVVPFSFYEVKSLRRHMRTSNILLPYLLEADIFNNFEEDKMSIEKIRMLPLKLKCRTCPSLFVGSVKGLSLLS